MKKFASLILTVVAIVSIAALLNSERAKRALFRQQMWRRFRWLQNPLRYRPATNITLWAVAQRPDGSPGLWRRVLFQRQWALR